MKTLITILLAGFILSSCNGLIISDDKNYISADTVYIKEYIDTMYLPVIEPSRLQYNITNSNRTWGGSPDIWYAGMWVSDSTGIVEFWPFTEVEVNTKRQRAKKFNLK